MLNALQRLADGYDYDCRRLKSDITVKRGQLADYEARLGRPFEHAAYKDELEGLRDQLKIGLSEHPPEGSTPVSELAGRIGKLRAANTVEAAPVRTGARKTTRAETPVTARIRERMGEKAVEVAVEPEVAMPEPVQKLVEIPSAVIAMPEPEKPVNGHAGAVTSRRQVKPEQLRLF